MVLDDALLRDLARKFGHNIALDPDDDLSTIADEDFSNMMGVLQEHLNEVEDQLSSIVAQVGTGLPTRTEVTTTTIGQLPINKYVFVKRIPGLKKETTRNVSFDRVLSQRAPPRVPPIDPEVARERARKANLVLREIFELREECHATLHQALLEKVAQQRLKIKLHDRQRALNMKKRQDRILENAPPPVSNALVAIDNSFMNRIPKSSYYLAQEAAAHAHPIQKYPVEQMDPTTTIASAMRTQDTATAMALVDEETRRLLPTTKERRHKFRCDQKNTTQQLVAPSPVFRQTKCNLGPLPSATVVVPEIRLNVSHQQLLALMGAAMRHTAQAMVLLQLYDTPSPDLQDNRVSRLVIV